VLEYDSVCRRGSVKGMKAASGCRCGCIVCLFLLNFNEIITPRAWNHILDNVNSKQLPPFRSTMAKGKSGDAKGSSKRLKKVIRDSSKSIARPAVRRLARRAGVKRVSGLLYDEVRGVIKSFVEVVVRDSIAFAEHSRRKTIGALDVVYGLRRRGRLLYGY